LWRAKDSGLKLGYFSRTIKIANWFYGGQKMDAQLTIIGGGLAGSEAAWQAAQRGIKVELYEMRPQVSTPAHHTGLLAELVCSNSLRSDSMENAVGVLKEEMRLMNSLIMYCADRCRIPAGGALAVDREEFSRMVTDLICNHPNITLINKEVTEIPSSGVVILATGPLTSDRMAQSIKNFTGEEYLYFYDAAAPIVTYDSINLDKVFRASRYGKGTDDYLNCPMTEEEFNHFYEALIKAEKYQPKEFEKKIVFEGCMPIEEMAERGRNTLLFGPLKPVGLIDPKTNKQPYAVVQLRQDNREGTLYNLVGFQTQLKWGDQDKIFRMIPGLERAEFVRHGVMHRNTYINSPVLLEPTYQLKSNKNIFFAGQITGVEGYVESTASGLVAGINAVCLIRGLEPFIFPKTTCLGALSNYITSADPQNFQPMNINFGLLPELEEKLKKGRGSKKEKRLKLGERAINSLVEFKENLDFLLA
jgi:methylenetetrahydrofolate--tRNA-(uracil-5-)-methyltransferase